MDRRPAVLVVAAWVLLSTAAGLYSLHRLWQRSAAESDAENGARSSEQVESGGRPAVEPDGESGDSFLACLDAAPPGVHPRALETQNREALVLERMSRGVRSAAGERWRPIGSTNLASPTMAASIVPGQEDVALACGLGGIWLGALRGSETWRCVGSGLGHGAHALVATNADPLSIVSITREGRVQATTDGGSTWFMPGGLPDQILGCVRLLPDPSDASVVWLLVRGRIWTGNQLPTGYHLCCSRDGGTTFAVVHSEPDWPPCDIWTGRTGAAPLFLLCGESLKRSMRAGADFTEVGRIAGAGSGQGEAIEGVALTGSEAGAPTLYASLSRGGRWMLHRSIDGGRSWEPRAALPRFSATLCASIRDPDLLLLGGGRCLRSVDGGRTFLPLETEAADRTGGAGLPQGTVHGIDCFWIAGREVILLHTEGGSFASVDAASTFQDLAGKGLCAGTYYATLTSPGDPYLILAASEGQGMQRSKSRLRSKSMTETTDGMGPASFAGMLDFEPLVAGRFLQIVSADPDSSPVWALAREHLLVLEDPHAGPSSRRSVPFPAGSDARAGAFLAIDPTDRSTVHLCANGLWSCRREAAGLWSWTPDRRIRAPGRLAVFAIAAADPSFRLSLIHISE
ncbi:MAG: hypothetical protein QUU85_17845, partial [Candidatus Eisenbacteria bacterium]|nr:hypothetical protein [Candidatus Eisenbacteria bacterium]